MNTTQSKLISKNAKLKSYFSVIRPVIIYACETWILTLWRQNFIFRAGIKSPPPHPTPPHPL